MKLIASSLSARSYFKHLMVREERTGGCVRDTYYMNLGSPRFTRAMTQLVLLAPGRLSCGEKRRALRRGGRESWPERRIRSR